MPEKPTADLFFDDAPKQDPAADRLGHGRFADRIINVVASLSAPSGYVIGLHGPWGSGKSTVLNFVERGLKERAEGSGSGPLVVRFEPWIISGHKDLTGSFMKLLAERLPRDKGVRSERLKRGVARILRGGADDVIDAIAAVGVIADASGGAATKLAGSLGKKSIASAASKWLEEPSLQASYNVLVDRLKALDQRFVIMVDDIERLSSEEIRDLMAMVKTLGKLPNVIYLLSYDRNIVWEALKTVDPDPRSGAFAEKIVQHEVELPVPSRAALLSMLSDALGFLDLDTEPSERRYALTRAGVGRWVRQPRDVVRLANSLRFAWAALEGEIDQDDLICMEGLRLNDRDLFDWIRDNREMLIEDSMPYSAEEKARLSNAFADQFKGARADAVNLMLRLFPNRSEIFKQEKFGLSAEAWTSVRARRGIATPAGYDAYFSFNPGSSTLTKRLVDRTVSSFDDAAQLEAHLRVALQGRDEFGNTLIGAMFEELSSRLDQGARATQTLLSVLIWLAEEVDAAPWSGDLITPRMQHYFLITDILKRWSPDERVEHLRALYESAPPLSALASLHVDLARSIGALPGGSDYLRQFVSGEELDELGAKLIARIQQAETGGSLNDQPAYYDIARVWALHGDAEKARAWLSSAAHSSAANLAKVALGLLGYSRTIKGRQYGMSERPDESLYDIDALIDACSLVSDLACLTPDEAARVRALSRGLQDLRERQTSASNGSGNVEDRDDSSDR